MTVIRLIGGLTPGDAGDPRTFPEIFNAAADVIDASEAGLSVVEGAVGALQDDVVELETRGFRIVETLYFTSNGTFTKADFPWLRAIRVKCQGGGGGGGGADATGVGVQAIGGAGGGGAYGESFITDIPGLDSSVTVTRGSGGAGGAAGNNAGSAGGSSFFGALVSAVGGDGGGAQPGGPNFGSLSGNGGNAATADLLIRGDSGSPTRVKIDRLDFVLGASGGGSHLGPNAQAVLSGGGLDGRAGSNFGGGAIGGSNAESQTIPRPGGNGANGIVIIELFA